MRPRARWAPKGRPARLTFVGGPNRGAGAAKGTGLRSVAPGDGDEPDAAGSCELPDAYHGRHRRPPVADEAGAPPITDWATLPSGGWIAPPPDAWIASRPGDCTAPPPSRPGDSRPLEGREVVAVREAVAEERLRIARDLHDSVDKSLHGIALAAASLASSLTPPVSPLAAATGTAPGTVLATAQDTSAAAGTLDSRLRELASLARYAISETRCVIYELRDDTFAAPLGELLRNLAREWSAGSGVPVSLAVPPATDAASETRREIIAILREALRNAEAHAHATRVRVSLRKAADRILLTISDNGAGFALPAGSRGLQAAAHYGLIGMTERARKLGGTLVIRSRPGHGTRIAVQVPARATDGAR